MAYPLCDMQGIIVVVFVILDWMYGLGVCFGEDYYAWPQALPDFIP